MANPLDMMKMVRNYRKTQGMLKNIKAAGQSFDGLVAILIDGTMDVIEVEVSEQFKEATASGLSKAILQAYKLAKKELEKQLKNNTSPDQLREMMGI